MLVRITLDKYSSEGSEIFIENISDIQFLLPDDFRSDGVFPSQLFLSVRNVHKCRLAYQKHTDKGK